MRDIVVDIDALKKPEDVLLAFESNRISAPHNTRFIFEYSAMNEVRNYMILVLLEAAFESLRENPEITFKDLWKAGLSESLNDVLGRGENTRDLEREIEKRWDILLEWKPKSAKKETKAATPTDEVFGLWKESNINLKQIRKTAWPERD